MQLYAGKTNKWWLTHLIASGLIPRASYQIRKIAGAHAPGMQGTFLPPPRVSDPDMHHGTCVTHEPWCMPGSLTSGFLWSRRRGETFPTFPAHAWSAVLRIWTKTHGKRAAMPVNKLQERRKIDQFQTATKCNKAQSLSKLLRTHCTSLKLFVAFLSYMLN